MKKIHNLQNPMHFEKFIVKMFKAKTPVKRKNFDGCRKVRKCNFLKFSKTCKIPGFTLS